VRRSSVPLPPRIIAALLVAAGCGTSAERIPNGLGGAAGTCAASDSCGSSAGGLGGAAGTSPSLSGGPVVSLEAGAPSAPECVREQVHFERELPNVMLVIDGSASMSIPDFDADLRWEAVKKALIDDDTGLVTTLESRVRFGLTMYFNSAPSGEPVAACPVLEGVPIALDNLDAISRSLKSVWPRGTTPTGESLEQVWPELVALDADQFRGPRIIVLATDGEPTGCDNDKEQARARSISAVRNAYAAAVRTFVIGVGPEATDAHLRELANLGQGHLPEDPGDRFHRVFDTQQLAEALGAIAGDVQECVFDLNGTVAQTSASAGDVTLDGLPLEHDDPNGWHLVSPTRLSIDGSACEAIQSADDAVLDISFPCGVFVPL
jgi:hypothetical protein